MSGIGPKNPARNFIAELKQKQEAKKAPAAPVVAQPQAKKMPVVPPLQGALLMKQPQKAAMPAMPKKQAPVGQAVPKEARPLPKQPMKQAAPVHQPKAAPKPMTAAEHKEKFAKEFLGMEYRQLPLDIQALVTKNIKNPEILVKEFNEFISSIVSKVALDSFEEVKRFEGGVFHFPEEHTDRFSNLSFEDKAMKFVDLKSGNVGDLLGADYFDGGLESKGFRKFCVLFMKSMLPDNFPLIRDMGHMQQIANAQMPFFKMFVFTNLMSLSEMIEEAPESQKHMRFDVPDLGVPGNYLTMVPPMIARLKQLEALDIGYQGTAYYVPDLLLPETMLKLENLHELYLHGMKPVDGDDNEVVKALRARGCKVVFGETYTERHF